MIAIAIVAVIAIANAIVVAIAIANVVAIAIDIVIVIAIAITIVVAIALIKRKFGRNPLTGSNWINSGAGEVGKMGAG